MFPLDKSIAWDVACFQMDKEKADVFIYGIGLAIEQEFDLFTLAKDDLYIGISTGVGVYGFSPTAYNLALQVDGDPTRFRKKLYGDRCTFFLKTTRLCEITMNTGKKFYSFGNFFGAGVLTITEAQVTWKMRALIGLKLQSVVVRFDDTNGTVHLDCWKLREWNN